MYALLSTNGASKGVVSLFGFVPCIRKGNLALSEAEVPLAKKKSVDLFAEDNIAPPQNEFDQLLNSSTVNARGLRAGDKFRGEVLAVNGQEAFISSGTPTDAVMLFDLATPPKTGDMVEVIVIRAREGEILVKAVGSRGVSAETDSLEDAYDMELPVEGVVLEAVKGGFRVKIQGQKAFCPISQMDWRVVSNDDYIGKKFSFIVTKFERGRDLVVSRRKLLEQDRAVSEGEFLRTTEVGTIFSATVFRIEKYGAFVRLPNGVEGLVPISELSWGRINHPQEVVNLEQTLQVKLIRVSEEGDRLKLSFSLKQGGSTTDPWATIESDFPIGAQFEGTIEHRENFGIFVSIATGVTGLLPRSAWREAIDGAQYETKRKGDKVRVRVEKIDLTTHKLSFSVPRDDEDESWRSSVNNEKTASFGTLGDLLKGVRGK